MTLLGPRILARPVIPDRIGSVILPDAFKSAGLGAYRIWTVLQTGPGRVTRKGVTIPVETKPGDRIVTSTYIEGTHQFPDGTAILEQDQVLMIIGS